MMTRTCAIGIVKNERGQILVCRMPEKRGAYPNEWGILGGGIEEDEKLVDTLKREAKEELGITIDNIVPFTFHDDERDKYFADGHVERVYMIYCIYDCDYTAGEVELNDEWAEYKWLYPNELNTVKLNEPTIKTFKLKGWL